MWRNSQKCAKMNIIFTLLLLILPSSCSSASVRVFPKKKGVDSEFKPYIQDYKSIINFRKSINKKTYDQRISKLSVSFDKLEYPVIGQCHWLMNGEFEIQIDRTWWSYSSPISRKFLVYHELEHCVRFRMHTHTKTNKDSLWDYIRYLGQLMGIIPNDEYFADGCPNSIMHPADTGDYCNYEHYEEYIQEMVNYQDIKLE